MKSTIIAAVLALSLISCKKDSFKVPDVTPQPELKATIFPEVNQPRVATLGESTTIFTVGEQMTIFVPYEISRDQLTNAKLVVKDEAGDVLNVFDMTNSTELNAWDLTVPVQIQGSNFVFATIGLDEVYAGKLLTIEAQVSGNHKTSDATIKNAFSVQF